MDSTGQLSLPLVGGMVRTQRRTVPDQALLNLPTYRHACRLAWKLRHVRNLKRKTLAEAAGLYASHVTDYFSVHENRRELPARHIADVERVLGNLVISQWLELRSRRALELELREAA